MDGFELGKSIQEITMRLERIEAMLGGGTSSEGGGLGRKCKDKVCRPVRETAVPDRSNKDSRSDSISATWGRIDAGECECREQTITVYRDGRYTHVAVHHNHSRGFDDGDTHRLTIHVRAGDRIIHSFGSERFVPKGQDRTKQTDGQSDNIAREFDAIDNFDCTLECD